ncbi:MAG: hypothetical protein VYB17_00590 [Candidatus Thermoplasmatota archaeon]|nr:hypothetical protein [Candidatus Thermoplasmatota archaeon]
MDGIVPNLQEMREIVNRKASEKRDTRDELNKNVGGFLSTRNDFNRQVLELISEVQRQKVIRE